MTRARTPARRSDSSRLSRQPPWLALAPVTIASSPGSSTATEYTIARHRLGRDGGALEATGVAQTKPADPQPRRGLDLQHVGRNFRIHLEADLLPGGGRGGARDDVA